MTEPPSAPPPAPTPRWAVARRLDFEFEVGEVERHRVHLFFDQFWGPVSISVDGRRVIRGFRMFSLSTAKHYRFAVGGQERHDVVIELRRRRMVAGFRPQVCRVFVDRRCLGEYSS